MTLVPCSTSEVAGASLDAFGLNPAAVEKLRSFVAETNLVLLAGGRHIISALLRTLGDELANDRALLLHIGDAASAGEAVAAYVRGQLVIATTNALDVIGALQTVVDGGIDPSIVMALEPVVVTIHSLRKLCRCCAEPVGRMTDTEERLSLRYGWVPLFRARGCADCAGTGYAGVIPYASLSIGTDPVMIDDRWWASELLARGQTTVEEIVRGVSGL